MVPRFLADESCDFRMVRAPRSAGYDVLAVVEDSPGATDPEVLERAWSADRVLITEDRDFGQLAHAHPGGQSAGVLFVRCPEPARARLPQSIVSAVHLHGEKLAGRFAVWTPIRLRLR